MTPLTFNSLEVPLSIDPQGAIRVGGTRMLLDVLIYEFDSGATPEEIVDCYEGLDLADVYAVLSYCLRNRPAINEYQHRREAEADALRRTIESSQPPRPDWRAARLARQKARRNGITGVSVPLGCAPQISQRPLFDVIYTARGQE